MQGDRPRKPSADAAPQIAVVAEEDCVGGWNIKRRRLQAAIAAVVLCLAGTPASASPANDDLLAALADVTERVALADRPTTRYLSLDQVAAEDRPAVASVASYLVNSVSRHARITPVTPVPKSAGRLLRIDLNDYKLSAGVWEALVSDNEPYWHLTTEVIDPATKKRTKVYTDGGWINLAAAAALRSATHSGGAIVRADWFVARVSTPPHYYNFAGVAKAVDEWNAALGVDREAIVRLNANRGANLFISGVTHKPRRISRWQGPLGGVWQTYDTFGVDPAHDPIRNPTFTGGYDASEHIAAKANGLHLFALYNAKGERQDSVPDRLAKDDSDPHGDGVLAPMISCVRCHVEDGLRPFADDQSELAARNVLLFAQDAKTAEQLSSFYDAAALDRHLRRDREDYAAAVAKATGGLSTRQLVQNLATVFRSYRDDPVTAAVAAAELGLADLAALRSARDPILLALASGVSVQRGQWEASFAEAASLAAVARAAPSASTSPPAQPLFPKP
jgi:hypothetical protein